MYAFKWGFPYIGPSGTEGLIGSTLQFKSDALPNPLQISYLITTIKKDYVCIEYIWKKESDELYSFIQFNEIFFRKGHFIVYFIRMFSTQVLFELISLILLCLSTD